MPTTDQNKSFIININKIAENLDKLININGNIENIKLSDEEINNITDVKNNLQSILLVTQKADDISAKHQDILQKAQATLDKYNEILQIKQALDTESKEVKEKHTEVVNLASDANTKINEVKNLSVQIQLLDETESASANYNSSSGTLTLGVPRGLTGKQGDSFRINAYGTEATKSMYDDVKANTSFFALDSETLYFKISDDSGAWSQGVKFGKGAKGDSLTMDSIDDNGDGTFTWHFSDGTDYITPSLAGKQGDKGLAPEHEKIGDTSIRFRNPDGSWGEAINLVNIYSKDETNDLLNKKSDLDAENTFTKTNTFAGKVIIGDKTFNDPDIYSLGTKGQIGFGVATAPRNMMNKAGCIGLDGHDVIGSKAYGNYLHLKSGAVLVYIPKHYYKLTGNTPDFSDTPQAGYVLDRSFINGGIEIDGIFVGKYGATNNNGTLSSQAGQDPLSTHSDHNPISSLDGTHINNYGGMYTAIKTMDSNAVVTPNWVYSMLARIALAQGQSATNTTSCAYIDVNPKMPKGCLGNALKDYNDSSVTFTSSGYSNCALTGSGSNFAKTTHNGQENGIADLNGNMWEIGSGFIRTDSDGFLILKESVDIRTIVDDNSADATGAYFIGNYDVVDISDVVSGNDGWTYLGNGANQVFPMSTDRNSISYKKNALGIPNTNGHSASGTTEFGNDGVYRYLRNEMAALRGGYWGYSSSAGVGAVSLNGIRSTSDTSLGGRACIIV